MIPADGNHINRELAEQVEREIAELDAKLTASAEKRPNERPVRRWFRELFWLYGEYRKCTRELKDYERQMRADPAWGHREWSKHPAFVRLSKYL